MKVVESAGGVRELAQSMHESSCYVRPVFKSSDVHPAPSELSFAYVDVWESGQSFVVAKNHHEAQRAPESAFRVLREVSPCQRVVSDLKATLQSLGQMSGEAVDLDLAAWWAGENLHKPQLEHSNVIQKASNKLWHTPIYKLAAQLAEESREAKELFGKCGWATSAGGFSLYNDGFLRALSFLESEGIAVDKKVFDEHFGDKPEQVRRGKVYPRYSMYTSTGRPSNAFNKVNYAALEKGAPRRAFVSRFEDGRLAELDYDAFHLRLIADRVGYEFSGDSVHEHLGKQYFGTDSLTQDQYDESKTHTFFWLYNGLTEEALEYEYFRRVQGFIDAKWDAFQNEGEVRTLLVGRPIREIQDPTPNKVFNYLVQSLETEVALTALDRARRTLRSEYSGERPKICLYTYDSFLLDVPAETDNLSPVRQALSFNGKFPMSLEQGQNYGDIS